MLAPVISESSQELLQSTHFDHFLVEHTVAAVPHVAEAVNKNQYDLLFLEMNTDEATRTYHGSVIQGILDGRIAVDKSKVPERDVWYHLAAELVQKEAYVVMIDNNFGDEFKEFKDGELITKAEYWRTLHQRARHNELRDPFMVQQISDHITELGIPNLRAAIITGGQHTYPSAELRKLGANVNRIFTDRSLLLDGTTPKLHTEKYRFDPASALIRAIQYGVDELEVRKRFNQLWSTF